MQYESIINWLNQTFFKNGIFKSSYVSNEKNIDLNYLGVANDWILEKVLKIEMMPKVCNNTKS